MMNDDKLLVTRRSAFNEIRVTEDAYGIRMLTFGESVAFQSIIDLENPRSLALDYARLLPACLAFVRDPRRILFVGLGGGTLPRFFRSHFPLWSIDIVEIDPVVAEVARSHCGFQEDATMRVHIADGRDFIEASPGGYDMIVLDGFDIESIPTHLTTEEFLAAVRRALSPQGIAVANVWGHRLNDIYPSMLLTYRSVFDQVYVFDVPGPGTKLLVALPFQKTITRAEVLAQVLDLAVKNIFEYDLAAEITGFQSADLEPRQAGRILRD